MNFPKGKEGVTIVGNVVLGDAAKQGTTPGRGVEDFANVTWDGEKHDATPSAKAPFASADVKYLLETDFTGAKRTTLISGAVVR
jgi:hypothetical protein